MKPSYANYVVAMIVGSIVIYSLGATQGKLITKLPWNAIVVGWVLPFIIGDVIKLLLAAWIAKNIDAKKYMK